jgi:protein TIF31
VLQAINENALSLNLLLQVQRSSENTFGADHLSNGHALHQLTQAYFLVNDVPKALEVSLAAYEIFKARVGEENQQTKEVGRNVELLQVVVENVERQKANAQMAKDRAAERLQAAQARVAATTRRRPIVGPPSTGMAGSPTAGTSAAGAAAAAAKAEQAVRDASRIGEKGHLDVDELVKFIDGQAPSGGAKRGKNALRGKRRTGAKR